MKKWEKTYLIFVVASAVVLCVIAVIEERQRHKEMLVGNVEYPTASISEREFDRVQGDWERLQALLRPQYVAPDPNWDPNKKLIYTDGSSSDPADADMYCIEMSRDNPDADWIVVGRRKCSER